MDNEKLKMAKEIAEIVLDTRVSIRDLIDEYKKVYSLTDQSIKNKLDTKTTN